MLACSETETSSVLGSDSRKVYSGPEDEPRMLGPHAASDGDCPMAVLDSLAPGRADSLVLGASLRDCAVCLCTTIGWHS